jgi:hypothetical protein
MQKNLTSKKRSYLSLALLLSCVAHSAYGMSYINRGLSGVRSYFNNIPGIGYIPGFGGATSNNETNVVLEEDGEEPLSDPRNKTTRKELPEQVELINEAQGSSSVQPELATDIVSDSGSESSGSESEYSSTCSSTGSYSSDDDDGFGPYFHTPIIPPKPKRISPNERSRFLAQVHERRIAGSHQESSNSQQGVIALPWRELENTSDAQGAVEQQAPQLNTITNVMKKIKSNKGRVAVGVGVAAAVGATTYAYRKPIARHLTHMYQKAKQNAKTAWQKLQNKKVTKGTAVRGALGLAGTAATVCAARAVYQNQEAARSLLSNRKAQLVALGAVALGGTTKLAHSYLTKNTAGQSDVQAADARNIMIDELVATFTEEQWSCLGVTRAVEAFVDDNVALGIEILVDSLATSALVLSDTQAQKFQAILDILSS